MNKIKQVFLILFFLILVLSCVYIYKRKTNIPELRTDIKPINNHFPMLENIERVYWISGKFGTSMIGPSDIWIKGFIILNEENFKKIISNYKWEKINIDLDERLFSKIIEINEFEWYVSKDFSKDMAGSLFMGESFIDVKNKIIYIDFTTY